MGVPTSLTVNSELIRRFQFCLYSRTRPKNPSLNHLSRYVQDSPFHRLRAAAQSLGRREGSDYQFAAHARVLGEVFAVLGLEAFLLYLRRNRSGF